MEEFRRDVLSAQQLVRLMSAPLPLGIPLASSRRERAELILKWTQATDSGAAPTIESDSWRQPACDEPNTADAVHEALRAVGRESPARTAPQ